jgi:hypothetical protein
MSMSNVFRRLQSYFDLYTGVTLEMNANTLAVNTIAEGTSGSGVTIDSVLVKDNNVDLNGVGAVLFDADGDTKMTSAESDDEITVTINGAADFVFSADTLTAVTGSSIVLSGANISPAARIVNVAATETAVALTSTAHAERLVVLPIITSAGLTITLPAATGTGHKYTVINNGVQTLSTTVTALAGDIFYGIAKGWSLTAGANDTFVPDGNDIKYTMDVTTTGGDGGDTLTFIDIATDKWWTDITFHGSGTLATGYA